MERELEVFVDFKGQPVFAGRLWSRHRSGRESCTFAYDSTWLANGFPLSPSLPLGRGPQNTPHGLFGVFSDAAPDSWGQHLMHIDERFTARTEKRPERTLFSVDYLAAVNDETRTGALRFKNPAEETFLTTRGKPVPPVIDVGALMNASLKLDQGKTRDADIKLVLDPGSAMGGARPKAVVRASDGRLLLAKFEKKTDSWPLIRWEAATLDLAKAAGIRVPEFELPTIAQKAVLMMVRFDRFGAGVRVPFLSAMSAIGAHDHERGHSYLEIAEVIRQESDAPSEDLEELWRRIVFNILVSNTDDHLRNHAFLWNGRGWRLSPAYDMNPTPIDIQPRVHQLAIDERNPSASLETAFSVAPSFGFSTGVAKQVAADVGRAVAAWREAASARKIIKDQIDRMSSAFDHADLRLALANQTSKPGARPSREGKSKATARGAKAGKRAPKSRRRS
ncbi:MAG: type II toxin-antitoxin system HipA family toxin [Vitreimonas sp.]